MGKVSSGRSCEVDLIEMRVEQDWQQVHDQNVGRLGLPAPVSDNLDAAQSAARMSFADCV